MFLGDIQETIVHYGGGETFTITGGYLDIGIVDTIKDLFVNFIGAIVFSTFGYFYVRQRDTDRPGFAGKFIPVVQKGEDRPEAEADSEGTRREGRQGGGTGE